VAKIVGELGVRISADADELAADIRAKVQAALREASTAQIPLGIDHAQLVREIKAALADAQAEAGNIQVRLDLDTEGFSAGVKAAVAEAQAAARAVKLGFNIDVQGLAVKVKAAAELAAKEATIKPKVDPKTAELDFKEFTSKLKSELGDLQKGFAGAAQTIFTGLFKLGLVSTIAVGVSQLVSSVIALSGAAGLVPGALFSMVGAVAALKIGVSGFSTAIKDIGTDKFAGDVAKLAPSAREAAQAIATIKPQLEGLKLDVQQQLFQGFGARIKELSSTLLPTLRSGLAGFADSLNQTAQGVFSFLTGSGVRSDLPELFNTAQASVFNLGQALPAVLSILENVGVVGSQAFAELTGGAGAATQRVADFVQQARQSGALANFIQTGIDAFRQLFAIVGNVVSIFLTLSNAIGGGGLLGLLAQLTGSLNQFLQSAAGTAALQALGAALRQIAGAAGKVFLQLLTSIGEILTKNAPDIANFASAVGDALVSAIQTLAPLLSGLLSLIGKDPELWANIAIGVGALALALQALVPVVTVVAALIAAGTVGLVAAIVAAVIAAVVLVIVNFDKIKAAISTALDAVGSFFSFLGGVIAGAFQSAVSFVVGIWNGVVSFFVGIGTAIGSAVTAAVDAVVSFFVNGFNAIVSFVGTVIGAIINFFVALPGQIVSFLVGLPAQVGAVISQMAFEFGFIVGSIVRFFVDLPGNIVDAVTTLIPLIGEWAVNVWTNVTTFFATGIANVIAFVSGLPQMVIDAITNLEIAIGIWALNVWANVSTSFVNGVNNVIAFVSGLPGQVINAVNSLLFSIGLWAVNVWNNVQNAFVNGGRNVLDFAIGLPGQIVNGIGALGSRLYQVGVDALQGLLNGLRSIAGNILGWVKGLVGDILHGFTSGFDSHSPSRETYSIGRDVAQGLANALRDSREMVGRAAGDLANAGLAGLDPLLNPDLSINTSTLSTAFGTAGQSVTPQTSTSFTVQQTNVMQQGTDVRQFADTVWKNGATALANGSSLLAVSQKGVSAGIDPNFVGVSGV
jgi:hypothetical protein